MRAVNLIGLLILGVGLAVIAPPITTGQPGGFGKKGGGPGGPGGLDPGMIFDNFLAKGRNYFLISESRRDGTALTQFAQERGISNGQISRQQYLDFYEWKQKQAPAGMMMPGGFGKGGFPGGKGGFPGGIMQPPGGAPNQPSPEAIGQLADQEFKNRDRNQDGILTPEEMPRSLRDNLSKWDKNGDGQISLAEFREYFADYMMNRANGESGRNGPATIIIQEEDLDAKPVVYRAGGAMPAGLPAWFKDLDTDGDGQVAPYEWRRAGKSMDEFANWDLNGDGFITPDEALKQQAILAKNSKGSPGNSIASASGEGGPDPRAMMMKMMRKGPPGDGSSPGKGAGGWGGGPGGFGKGKKGNKDRSDKSSDQ